MWHAINPDLHYGSLGDHQPTTISQSCSAEQLSIKYLNVTTGDLLKSIESFQNPQFEGRETRIGHAVIE
jgi:hypothetical protein